MAENETLIDVLNTLKKKGYTEDFNLKQNCIECRNGEYRIFHNEFEVDEYFRFDNDSDPADQSILYAISSEKYNLKGVLINSYGIYSEEITDEMLDKLNMKK
ncbi:phosphoribosylpyrophosphate synthetase [Empedobacter sedimenti]|uniref:phosphoribosylpyrophosphate synthetase n=1 Tax=Empedobacter sedimenti TaxID=3042610 RepID=UPI0024A6D3B2|nr:phosphoribosylpyrophosphate synthetase [Empedobacter sedimenti]